MPLRGCRAQGGRRNREANARDWYGTDIFGDVGADPLRCAQPCRRERNIDNLRRGVSVGR